MGGTALTNCPNEIGVPLILGGVDIHGDGAEQNVLGGLLRFLVLVLGRFGLRTRNGDAEGFLRGLGETASLGGGFGSRGLAGHRGLAFATFTVELRLRVARTDHLTIILLLLCCVLGRRGIVTSLIARLLIESDALAWRRLGGAGPRGLRLGGLVVPLAKGDGRGGHVGGLLVDVGVGFATLLLRLRGGVVMVLLRLGRDSRGLGLLLGRDRGLAFLAGHNLAGLLGNTGSLGTHDRQSVFVVKVL